jgi:hypothetical protein
MGWRLLAVLIVVALDVAAGSSHAQTATADPPARVGRVSWVHGVLDARLPGLEGPVPWAPAPVNTPVTSDTQFACEAQSRAELRAGTLAIRLAGRTQAWVRQLDDAAVVLDIERGIAAVRVRQLAAGERAHLQSAGVTLSVQSPGSYRLDAEPQRERVLVRVHEGRGDVAIGPTHVELRGGQQTVVDLRTQRIGEILDVERNAFDDWADQRDRKQERVARRAVRGLGDEMTGIEALDDAAGQWRSEPAYGAVWYPNALPVDWAPYREGHWVWVSPWGWSWVDDAPWGFATTHYGRWLFLGGRWGWVAGGGASPIASSIVTPRPVYAPALVVFYGQGAAVDNSAPAVGWFPLAPGEFYRPAYSASVAYASTLNALSTSAAPVKDYRYARTSFAATVVAHEQFASAQPVASGRQAVTPSTLARVSVAGTHASPPPPQRMPAPRDSATHRP